MFLNKTLILPVVLAVSLSACAQQNPNQSNMETTKPVAKMANEADESSMPSSPSSEPAMERVDGMMEEDVSPIPTSKDKMSDQTSTNVVYADFSQSEYDAKLGKEPMLLFFHASWCPECRALDKVIQGSNLEGDVTLYKLDYDSEKELKKKYAIKVQHTVVAIDANGEVATTVLGPTSEKDMQAIVDQVI